jgi:hypothetical protein
MKFVHALLVLLFVLACAKVTKQCDASDEQEVELFVNPDKCIDTDALIERLTSRRDNLVEKLVKVSGTHRQSQVEKRLRKIEEKLSKSSKQTCPAVTPAPTKCSSPITTTTLPPCSTTPPRVCLKSYQAASKKFGCRVCPKGYKQGSIPKDADSCIIGCRNCTPVTTKAPKPVCIRDKKMAMKKYHCEACPVGYKAGPMPMNRNRCIVGCQKCIHLVTTTHKPTTTQKPCIKSYKTAKKIYDCRTCPLGYKAGPVPMDENHCITGCRDCIQMPTTTHSPITTEKPCIKTPEMAMDKYHCEVCPFGYKEGPFPMDENDCIVGCHTCIYVPTTTTTTTTTTTQKPCITNYEMAIELYHCSNGCPANYRPGTIPMDENNCITGCQQCIYVPPPVPVYRPPSIPDYIPPPRPVYRPPPRPFYIPPRPVYRPPPRPFYIPPRPFYIPPRPVYRPPPRPVYRPPPRPVYRPPPRPVYRPPPRPVYRPPPRPVYRPPPRPVYRPPPRACGRRCHCWWIPNDMDECEFLSTCTGQRIGGTWSYRRVAGDIHFLLGGEDINVDAVGTFEFLTLGQCTSQILVEKFGSNGTGTREFAIRCGDDLFHYDKIDGASVNGVSLQLKEKRTVSGFEVHETGKNNVVIVDILGIAVFAIHHVKGMFLNVEATVESTFNGTQKGMLLDPLGFQKYQVSKDGSLFKNYQALEIISVDESLFTNEQRAEANKICKNVHAPHEFKACVRDKLVSGVSTHMAYQGHGYEAIVNHRYKKMNVTSSQQ